MSDTTEAYEMIACDKHGSQRAYIRFDYEAWNIIDLLEIVSDWAETDPDRYVLIGKAGSFKSLLKPTEVPA